jgi:protein-L-isoaspartate(D-aspartate) O-methyltransferase
MDYRLARLNMVESQVRPNEVTDRRILDAMLDIPRERFVPHEIRALAYMDEDLPLGRSGPDRRFLLAPRTLARLVQMARIDPGEIVLDVGCASGYSTALIARLAQAVVGLERDPALAEEATETLHALDADNVVIVTGPLDEGYAKAGPYDAIVVNGAIPAFTDALRAQLKEGGRLAAVVMDGGVARARCVMRTRDAFVIADEAELGALRLPDFAAPVRFAF